MYAYPLLAQVDSGMLARFSGSNLPGPDFRLAATSTSVVSALSGRVASLSLSLSAASWTAFREVDHCAAPDNLGLARRLPVADTSN
jgi:hypothetical protein